MKLLQRDKPGVPLYYSRFHPEQQKTADRLLRFVQKMEIQNDLFHPLGHSLQHYLHGTLSLDQSSRNFCLNFLTAQENKDTLLYQNTKLNFAVNCILSGLLQMFEKGGNRGTNSAKICCTNFSQTQRTHQCVCSCQELFGLQDAQEHGNSPRLPEHWCSDNISPPVAVTALTQQHSKSIRQTTTIQQPSQEVEDSTAAKGN